MTKSNQLGLSVYNTMIKDSGAGTYYKAAKTSMDTSSGRVHLVVSENWHENGGLTVRVFADKDGEADVTNVLNDCSFNGNAGDLLEATETYARRLVSGVKPEELFLDTQEAAIHSMEELSRKLKK